jgi:hypothetical protein
MATKTKTKTKKTANKKAKATSAPTEKLSQLAAAERVLADAVQPMTCKAMVEVMAAKGLWTSPGGKTPEATLYSSILRNLRSEKPRFKKVARGQFDFAKRPC